MLPKIQLKKEDIKDQASCITAIADVLAKEISILHLDDWRIELNAAQDPKGRISIQKIIEISRRWADIKLPPEVFKLCPICDQPHLLRICLNCGYEEVECPDGIISGSTGTMSQIKRYFSLLEASIQEYIEKNGSSREMSIVNTNVEQAQLWLTKVKKGK